MPDEQQGVEALENIIAALQSDNPEILDRCDEALHALNGELDSPYVSTNHLADRLAEVGHMLSSRARAIRERQRQS